MLKLALIAAALAIGLTGPALAQMPVPQSGTRAAPTAPAPDQSAIVDDCLTTALTLAEKSDNHTLSAKAAEKLDTMITQMEAHCTAREELQAQAVASQIKTLLLTAN
jgi:hypothetical protein